MKLISLVTQHFKKLGSQSVDFKSGLNIIAGDNAQGKSTLLEAIKMAFFGVAAMPCGKAEIPTWGQTKCSVTLKFELTSDTTYLLTRTLSTAKLLSIGADGVETLEANGHTPVTARIEELTGLTLKDWELFIQSSQGFATGILTFGATALNKKVEEFAGVDLIDKVQTLAARYAQRAEAQAEVQMVPAARIEELEQEVKAAQAEYDEAEASALAAQEALKAVGEPPIAPVGPTAAELRAGQREVNAADAAVDAAEQRLLAANQRVTDAQQALGEKKVTDAAALETSLEQLKAEGDQLKTQVQGYQASVKTLESAAHGVTSAQAALKRANEVLEVTAAGFTDAENQEKLDEATHALSQATDRVAHLNVKVGEAQAAHSSLKKLADGAVCPTCKRAKEDHDPEQLAKECAEAERTLEALRGQLKSEQESIAVYTPLVRNLTQAIEARSRASSEVEAKQAALVAVQLTLADLEGTHAGAAQKLADAEAELDAKRDQFARVREQLANVRSHNDEVARLNSALEKVRGQALTAKADFDAAMSHLEALPECATDEQVLEAEAVEAAYQEDRLAHSRALSQAEGNHSMGCQAMRVATDRGTRAHQAVADANKANEEAAANEKLSKQYDRLVRFLRERRQTYLKEVWDAVMSSSSRMVRRSSSDVITRVDNREGSFYFEEAGNIAPTTSASGAQKALIGTSIRVGLSRALYGSDSLMIFDEPTEGCTEFNASNMVAQLATCARQVLLITHREGDQALANHIINVGQ